MENIKEVNFKETELKNLILFKYSKNVLIFFQSLNIFTLEDLFNYPNILVAISESRISPRTKEEARGLIRLTKFKYLNEPLLTDFYLDNPIIFYKKYGMADYSFGKIHLESFGFTQDEKVKIIMFLNKKRDLKQYQIENENVISFGTIIGLFKTLLLPENSFLLKEPLFEKLNLYVRAYEDTKKNVNTIQPPTSTLPIEEETPKVTISNNNNNDLDRDQSEETLSQEIAFLEYYAKNLIKLRDEYNRKIAEVEERLQALKKSGNKGK